MSYSQSEADLLKQLADAQATVEALQAQLEAAERHNTILQDANKVALEKVEALQRERDEWRSNAVAQEARANDLERDCKDLQSDIEDERAKVKGLHEITKVICTHCCEPMEIPSKAVLQTQLTQLQALVLAAEKLFIALDFHLSNPQDNDELSCDQYVPPLSDIQACRTAINDYARTRFTYRATLDATTPAPMGSNILEEDIGKAMMRSKGGDGE